MLVELRMLEDVDTQVNRIGPIAEAYFSRVLLTNRQDLGPTLGNLRHIASRFAAEDANTDRKRGYPENIRALSL
jgi:hypothetical protein